MHTLVVYDSQFGNTQKIAETIAEAVKPRSSVRLVALTDLLPADFGSVDLLVVGGPTQRHGISARMRQFMDGLTARVGSGLMAAAFDTRYRMPVALSGSAAKTIARRLQRKGIPLAARPESFFVTRTTPTSLVAGETQRAVHWADELVVQCIVTQMCAA